MLKAKIYIFHEKQQIRQSNGQHIVSENGTEQGVYEEGRKPL